MDRIGNRIKSAEPILRRLAGTLELPLKMRIALQKGNYEEILTVYQKVLQVTSPSTKMKLLDTVKDSANAVIRELRDVCMGVLTATELPTVPTVTRFGLLLATIESSNSAIGKDALKQAFVKQLANFIACNRYIYIYIYIYIYVQIFLCYTK